jgi:hypothetical protein
MYRSQESENKKKDPVDPSVGLGHGGISLALYKYVQLLRKEWTEKGEKYQWELRYTE